MSKTHWTVPCECGGQKDHRSALCEKCETARRVSHGLAHTRLTHGHAAERQMTSEYAAWTAMRARCSNTRNPQHKDYGGRGIRVAAIWNSFEIFLANVGPKPSKRHSLDRIDNNGDYKPGNVRWATSAEQALNRRASLGLRDMDDEPISLQSVAYVLSMSYSQCRTAFIASGIIPRQPSDPATSRF